MRRRQGIVKLILGGLCVTGLAGCQSGLTPRRTTPAEPSLSMTGEPKSGLVVETPPARTVGVVERHPLLSKPREMYEKSGNNTVVKVGAATLVGVPMGIYGELKQIVVGRPPAEEPRGF
jgi:hypothetical protein